jgi:tRNA modification GTPase
VWVVRNKIDLDAVRSDSAGQDPKRRAAVLQQGPGCAQFRISASRGDGIQQLIASLIAFARDYFGSEEGGLIGRERQRKLLQETAASLQRSITIIGEGEELAAEDLRRAAYSLGRLLGRVDVEDILDVIFRDFCIGK